MKLEDEEDSQNDEDPVLIQRLTSIRGDSNPIPSTRNQEVHPTNIVGSTIVSSTASSDGPAFVRCLSSIGAGIHLL
jgi:hypothetical protein